MIIVAALAFVGLTATAQRQEKVVDRVDQRTVQEFDHQDVTKSETFYRRYFVGKTFSIHINSKPLPNTLAVLE